ELKIEEIKEKELMKTWKENKKQYEKKKFKKIDAIEKKNIEISIRLKGHSKSNKTNSKNQVMNRVGIPGERKSIIFCSFYRNIQKISITYSQDEDEQRMPAIVCFNLEEFEKGLK
ncbi:hypothetical protein RFI_00394, partial [Reticulomyxa filosa]